MADAPATLARCPSSCQLTAPLPRCLATAGYIAFFALMLSIGYEVQTHPPEGTQVDWPAILTPRPSDFAKEVTRAHAHTAPAALPKTSVRFRSSSATIQGV